ncbi:MAG: molybdopterin-binding protein [Actinobacteria bacterium HGW-Actinobacteria-5]|nr:MAG: molybdopterin-binding protein [Actinobacteria bacterium HGW-Actinobacteria-5]
MTSGIASIPLLAVKLWSVAPRFWKRPLIGGVLRMAERASVLVLVASAIFELVTGLLNVAEVYAFGFYFPPVHYAVAWLAIGAIAVHVAVQLPVVRRELGRPDAEPVSSGLGRRQVLGLAGVASLLAAVATAGDKLPFLRPLGVLSQRSGDGPQGVPVNRSAAAAGVTATDGWSLEVVDGDRTQSFTLAQMAALPQREAYLPIACVEGWNAWARWEGVRLADLIDAPDAVSLVVVSSPDRGGYGRSTVGPGTLGDPQTLLALRVNGDALAPDHGYPLRLIAPNRPGALQTKWVNRIEVQR